MSGIRKVSGGVVLNLEVKPGSPFNKTVFKDGKEIIIYLKNPPVQSKANRELVKTLSKALKVSRDKIRIVKGIASKSKSVLIEGLSVEETLEKLATKGMD